jgi:hypothetical protein
VTTTTARPRSETSPRKQVEQPRLHRDIETAGRLVHEDEPRPGDEIARDLQPLAHAARKGARLVVDPVFIDFDPAEPVGRGFADIAVMPVPTAISRSPTLAPADTVIRNPSIGFWCTKPQSVRIR